MASEALWLIIMQLRCGSCRICKVRVSISYGKWKNQVSDEVDIRDVTI
jgi:hypothetical protein